MNREIKSYLKAETIIAAAFNFFINGMVAALLHHKADTVPADVISVAIDLAATCLLMFTITALFAGASLRRTKTAGILKNHSRALRFLNRLFGCPALYGVLTGIATAIALFALTAPLFALLGIQSIPFVVYMALKCTFSALLGGCVAALALYVGMIAAE